MPPELNLIRLPQEKKTKEFNQTIILIFVMVICHLHTEFSKNKICHLFHQGINLEVLEKNTSDMKVFFV